MVDQLTLLNVGARWRLHADASLDLAGTRREARQEGITQGFPSIRSIPSSTLRARAVRGTMRGPALASLKRNSPDVRSTSSQHSLIELVTDTHEQTNDDILTCISVC